MVEQLLFRLEELAAWLAHEDDVLAIVLWLGVEIDLDPLCLCFGGS